MDGTRGASLEGYQIRGIPLTPPLCHAKAPACDSLLGLLSVRGLVETNPPAAAFGDE